MSDNMSYTDVLAEMQEIRQKWRDQTFFLDEEDKARYDMLLEVRRLRVRSFYEDGRVYTGGMQSTRNS